jgi:sensor histidine kinase regulating citrate/malate metabolism
LATTIIENAVTHAFTGEGEEYKVLITLSYNASKDVFTIDFKNNGNPMPQGMDKFRYGLKGEKGAKSHGTGLGGYRVKSITRHYNGDYDVFCNRTQNTTTIRVMFPKYNSHE